MPCEGCNVQFTVFRRKRICTTCRRYYCSHCLRSRNSGNLCERCAIFAKRPLSKIDLLQLKPKDLIFYLQSKKISTKGCVEKEELVGLVLSHINQNETPNVGNSTSSRFTEFSDTDKPFESIKQTCQNFFNNLTDKIASDFSLDTRTSASSNGSASNAGSSINITDQPRFSTREIPTYSSFNNQSQDHMERPPVSHAEKSNNSTPTSPVSSVGISLSTTSVESNSSRSPRPTTLESVSKTSDLDLKTQSRGARLLYSQDDPNENDDAEVDHGTELNEETIDSECECSDDELIKTFKHRTNRESGDHISTSSQSNSPIENQGPNTSIEPGVNRLTAQFSNGFHSKIFEDSSESSFEELGAIGGLSDDRTDSTWQFVNKFDNDAVTVEKKPPSLDESSSCAPSSSGAASATTSSDNAMFSSDVLTGKPNFPEARSKRVTRRRSDGYLFRRRKGSDQILRLRNRDLSVEEEDEDDVEDTPSNRRAPRPRKCCVKCGKNKSNIKRHVMKLRRHLEDAHMCEADIKRELEEFLLYLETRTRFDESHQLIDVGSATSPCLEGNEGIHVYPNADDEPGCSYYNSSKRYPDLNTFTSMDELENLTVKQLKQILTLNRVDYKGCCEKQELLERVSRLWKNLKSCPAIEKLPTDELCKICMDAPIECVILECGHMATCTNCGKVLSECPICRQYIVRVVRFFRA